VPWCSGCDRFLSPSTVLVDGVCPRCGATVDPGRAHPPEDAPVVPEAVPEPVVGAVVGSDPAPAPDPPPDDSVPLPWHFKALVAAIVLYLGWRAFQGVEWLARQF